MRESRLIFENLKVRKKSYNFFNCFKESTITNNFNIFLHFEFVLNFDLFKVFTLIEFIFCVFRLYMIYILIFKTSLVLFNMSKIRKNLWNKWWIATQTCWFVQKYWKMNDQNLFAFFGFE